MKERPILMTPENAQKVHDGVKVQTRRIMKPQPPEWVTSFGYTCFTPKGWISGRGTYKDEGPGEKFFKCPYGQVVDRLWIREAWRVIGGKEYEYQQRIEDVRYRGDLDHVSESCNAKWKPSLHMPRWACRTVVELTEIRVERVQEISDDDKIAEGMDVDTCMRGRHDQWIDLWNSINGQDSWLLNPWVWVLSFRKVDA